MFRRVTEGLNKSGGGIDYASKEGRTKLRGSILQTIAERKLKKHPDYKLLVQFFPNKLAKYRKMFEKLTGTREGQQKLTDFYNKRFAKKSERLPNIPTEKKLSVVPKKKVDVQSYTAFKGGKKVATGPGAVGPINEKSVFISARDRLNKSAVTKLPPLAVIPISEMHKHLMKDVKYRDKFKRGGSHKAIISAYNELIGRVGGKGWTQTHIDPKTNKPLSRTLKTTHNYRGGLPSLASKNQSPSIASKKQEKSMFISAKDSLLKGSNEPTRKGSNTPIVEGSRPSVSTEVRRPRSPLSTTPVGEKKAVGEVKPVKSAEPSLVSRIKTHTTNPPITKDLKEMYRQLGRRGVKVPEGISHSNLIKLYTKHYPTTGSRSRMSVTPVVERTGVTSPVPTGEGEKKNKSMFISAKDSLLKSVLTTEDREDLKQKQFALPKKAEDKEEKGESGNYPIPDLSHARNALAMVARYGSSAEQAKVRAAVYKKYPELDKRKDVEKASPKPDPLSVGPIGQDEVNKGKKIEPNPSPFIVGPIGEKEEEEEQKKSLDPALAARQNMKPMSTLGAMGGPVLGQVGFHNTTIGANFSKSENITFDEKTLRVLKRPNR